MHSLQKMIEKIEERPIMYLGKNYISCLKSFLDGWVLRDPENVIDYELLSDFQLWIENEYRIVSSQSWSDIILFYSQDECDALSSFFEIFEKYLNETGRIDSVSRGT